MLTQLVFVRYKYEAISLEKMQITEGLTSLLRLAQTNFMIFYIRMNR